MKLSSNRFFRFRFCVQDFNYGRKEVPLQNAKQRLLCWIG